MGPELDAADLAEVDEGDALALGRHAREAHALGGLVQDDLAQAPLRAVLGVEDGRLAVAVLVAARLGDDPLDARLAEHERCRALGYVDYGAIGENVLGPPVCAPAVLGGAPHGRRDHRVLVEVSGGDDVLPLVGQHAAQRVKRGIDDSHGSSSRLERLFGVAVRARDHLARAARERGVAAHATGRDHLRARRLRLRPVAPGADAQRLSRLVDHAGG